LEDPKQDPVHQLNMEQTINQSQETFVWHKDGYLVYGFIMFLILTFGFVGNVLTLLVLHQVNTAAEA
ncbi:hypothetical protein OS493_040483, partial [Desmophyllum pertusum]